MTADKDEWPTPPSERAAQCPADHTALEDGRCRDQYGEYNPTAGSPTPTEGKCNAALSHWRTRYGEKRYCTRLPRKNWLPPHAEVELKDHLCHVHKGRSNVIMRAEELLQHGAYTKTREHLYDKLDTWQKVVCWGLFESLLGDSVYEFAVEYDEREFDFSDSDNVPPQADEDGALTVEVPYATEKKDRSKALWCAAVDSMKMEMANAKIVEDKMERVTASEAELTDVDSDGRHAFTVLEEKEEHHLNLAYSRIVKDRKDLLSYGGVVTGTEADEEDSSIVVEDFTTVEADPTAVQDESGVLEIEAPTESNSNDDD